MLQAILETRLKVEYFPHERDKDIYERMEHLEQKVNQLITEFCVQHKISTPTGSLVSRVTIEKT